jgi:hypothetical protein
VHHSLTVEIEISHLSHVKTNSREIHEILQGNVDREIQKPGFVPTATDGKTLLARNFNGASDVWACSTKQKDLILKLLKDHHVDK